MAAILWHEAAGLRLRSQSARTANQRGPGRQMPSLWTDHGGDTDVLVAKQLSPWSLALGAENVFPGTVRSLPSCRNCGLESPHLWPWTVGYGFSRAHGCQHHSHRHLHICTYTEGLSCSSLPCPSFRCIFRGSKLHSVSHTAVASP